ENGFCVLRVKARGHRDLVTTVGHAAMISAGRWIKGQGGAATPDHTSLEFGPCCARGLRRPEIDDVRV
ncbi:hypothetical protein, partial [Roseovarius sp.]|uniref:YrrC family ATP-dependent DNA helicase n=1 Tax=Roseovarius sp. TaxID=1486281 RepID=UPI003561CE8C